jgi:hypothetical protein
MKTYVSFKNLVYTLINRIIDRTFKSEASNWSMNDFGLLAKNQIITRQSMCNHRIQGVLDVCDCFEITTHNFPILVSHVYSLREPIINTRLGIAFLDSDTSYRPIYSSSPFDVYEITRKIHVPSRKVQKIDGDWTTLSSRSYAHWLIEDLPRLLKTLEVKPNVGILITPKSPHYVNDAISILQAATVMRGEYFQPERLWFCSPTNRLLIPNEADIDLIRKKFTKSIELSEYNQEKIYISRRASSRSPANESEVESYFEGLGFKIVMLERESLRRQIELFSSANLVVGPHGAGLTNMVWMKSGKVIELFGQDRFENTFFLDLALACKVEFERYPTHEFMNILK